MASDKVTGDLGRTIFRGGSGATAVSRREILRWGAAAPVVLGVGGALSAMGAGTASAQILLGKVIVLDPGHNGMNAGNNKQVRTGRGGMKPCQTSGTSTDAGYTEHAFNWDVANRVADLLRLSGAQVQLSRPNDNSSGPCIDERAFAANAARPAAIVSIHADGGPAGGHGFHVNYSAPPLNAVQGGESVRFAKLMRDRLVSGGFTPATYIGSNGLYGRSDLTGLNLATFPAILIECGNMRNATDAAMLSSAAGRARLASTIAAGIGAFAGA